jgi:hypothetical protein
MNLNPEFQRQLILEFSPARLIGIPLILSIIFALTYIIDQYQFAEVTTRTALGLFLLIVTFWGSRQAVDSVLEEQRGHTWDTQRLSALDPWSMVSGKLFGSTLVVWYGGLICLLVYGVAANNINNFFWVCLYSVSSGLLVQSISLLLSLVALRKGQINNNSVVIGLAIIAAFMSASWIMPLAQDPQALSHISDTPWYGIKTSVQTLVLISVCISLFWVIVGNYRLMTQELRIRTTPWVWLIFSLFLIVYTGGFIPPENSDANFYALAFSISLLLCYLIVFAEPHEAMRIKRLITYIQQQNWQRAAEELPLWCVSFVIACIITLPLSFANTNEIVGDNLHIYPLAVLLLLLRDISIFLFFSYSKNPQRAFSLTLLSLVFLYGVLPTIFKAAEQHWLVGLLFPLTASSLELAIVYSVAQTSLVAYLLYKRWQESV